MYYQSADDMIRIHYKKKRGAAVLRFILSFLLLALCIIQSVQAAPQIIVNIPEYRLSLIEDGTVRKAYRIAVGTHDEQTPTGIYRIAAKEMFPTWFPGSKFEDKTPVAFGPENPLGTRWMEFSPAYGIHGTNKGWDINYPVSGGCIRMDNQDVEELYEHVEVGTSVTIRYESMVLEERPDGLYLKVWPDIYRRQLNTAEHFTSLYANYEQKYPQAQMPQFLRDGIQPETAMTLKIASPVATAIQPVPSLLPPKPEFSRR